MGLVSFYVLRVAADVGNFGLKNQIDRQTFKSILHFQVPLADTLLVMAIVLPYRLQLLAASLTLEPALSRLRLRAFVALSNLRHTPGLFSL
jgi:hypothetical protein